MADGIICVKCRARIDEHAWEMKRKLHAKTGHPFTPPRLCSECWFVSLLKFAADEEADA